MYEDRNIHAMYYEIILFTFRDLWMALRTLFIEAGADILIRRSSRARRGGEIRWFLDR